MELECSREGDAQLKGRNDRISSVPKQHFCPEDDNKVLNR